MTRRLAFLAALVCSNAAAFVAPLATRAVLHTTGRAPVLRRSATKAHGNAAPNMRYVATNRYERKRQREDLIHQLREDGCMC